MNAYNSASVSATCCPSLLVSLTRVIDAISFPKICPESPLQLSGNTPQLFQPLQLESILSISVSVGQRGEAGKGRAAFGKNRNVEVC